MSHPGEYAERLSLLLPAVASGIPEVLKALETRSKKFANLSADQVALQLESKHQGYKDERKFRKPVTRSATKTTLNYLMGMSASIAKNLTGKQIQAIVEIMPSLQNLHRLLLIADKLPKMSAKDVGDFVKAQTLRDSSALSGSGMPEDLFDIIESDAELEKVFRSAKKYK